MDEGSPDDDGSEDGFVQRTIDPNSETAEYDLLEIIAEEDGVEMDELPSLYEQVGHFVGQLFDDPPSDEAQMEIQFSYAGYRVKVSQEGHVTLVEVKQSLKRE